MTLLLRHTAESIVGAALWLGAAAALSLIPSLALTRRWQPAPAAAAIAGGLVAAGLSVRLGWGDPATVVLVGRPLPVAWLLLGAGTGAVAAWLRRRRVSGAVRAENPGPGAAPR